jgi:mono/diheme cytochrome c family protein
MLAEADTNADQKLSSDEFAALADRWFDQLDPDHLGRVTQEEFLPRFGGIVTPPGGAARGGRGVAGASTALGVFMVADRDHDRLLQRAELKQTFESWFPAWDTNKDGTLDLEEITNGFNTALPRTNMSGAAGRETQDPIPGLPTPPPAPVLTPAESMKTVQLAPGFRLELAASEPLLEDPVALSFDENGRAYVVEMRGYMLDIDRTGERDPISRISRLEDTDGDGRFDKSTVFIDGLILPRAIAAVNGGVLYVSDYQLYFARDTDGDGKADKTELIDADYGRGNVEHAPNGLFRAMDNWIYNGESPYRYRLVNGTLIKQETEVRGQWGMTQDNYGRLLYNVNNSQLLGDFAPPNYLSRNPHHSSSSGLNLFVSTDQRVFPIRMTTGVNRGYSPEVLDAQGRAYVFASSCSPVVYRGDNFPAEFVGNAFVADPAVNLIKRNLVFDTNLTLTSKFAYDNREFLASTDERFRPVSLYNGPDGTLWFIDLYRGVAQYSQFMTAYLRRETLSRGLEKGIHYGRLYRVVSDAKKPGPFPRLAALTSAGLVARLGDPNGWIRDNAQRLLVERSDRSIAPALAQLVASSKDAIARIHALWTLEGLFAAVPGQPAAVTDMPRLLKVDARFALEASAVPADVLTACLNAIDDADPKVQVAAIRVAEAQATGSVERQRALLQRLERLAANASPETTFQAALSAGNLAVPEVLPLLARLASRGAEHLIIRDAVVSGLQGRELTFLQLLLNDPQWAQPRPGRSSLLQALASAVIKERDPARIDALLSLAASQGAEHAWRTRGLLSGIAANLPAQPNRLVSLPSAPAAFETLAKSADAPTREQSTQIKTLFAWPGHQSDQAAKVSAARPLTAAENTLIAQGGALFQQLCSGCHGLAGQGIAPMAPPLANSDWVTGPENRLIRIVLQGASGPIRVNGTTYQPPNILPEMPGLGALDDTQIAAVLSFIRRSWGHEAAPISPTQVAAARTETREQTRPWTEAQLLEIK